MNYSSYLFLGFGRVSLKIEPGLTFHALVFREVRGMISKLPYEFRFLF